MKCGSLLPCPIYCLFILHSAVPHTHTARRTAPGPVLRRLRLRQVRRARQLRSLGRAELRRRSTTSGGTTAVRGTKGGTRERQYGGSTVREREREALLAWAPLLWKRERTTSWTWSPWSPLETYIEAEHGPDTLRFGDRRLQPRGALASLGRTSC